MKEHYNYFRDYDPSIGRYIESDPIALTGGINLYSYAKSPLTDTDPLGLMGRASGAAVARPAPGRPGFGGAAAFKGFCGSGWNQQFVPEGVGGASFSNACRRHDECYSRCGASKQKCDLDLRIDIKNECDKIPHGTGRWALCKTAAVDYHTAVDMLGGSAFNSAQQAAGCQPCAPSGGR